MGRITKDIRYKKRGKVYYYKLKGNTVFKTTGQTSKTAAERFVTGILIKQGYADTSNMMFSDYAEQFFDWNRCHHI